MEDKETLVNQDNCEHQFYRVTKAEWFYCDNCIYCGLHYDDWVWGAEGEADDF